MNNEVNVLALVKGAERYVFLYTDENRVNMIESFGRYASDPELSFTWYDAAVLTQKALREKRASELVAARKSFKNRLARPKTYSETESFGNQYDDLTDL